MKKLLIFLIICTICFASYLIGYNTTTTTTNLSLVKISSEDTTTDWFDNANDNLDLIDAIFDDVSLTEFGYLDGVTSAIQTQFGLRYLKTEMDSFSELQAIIADKTLVNVEDGITATAITDDLILKADFADEDWGDVSVSTNVVTLDAEVVDSEQYIDASIDHEHLAPDVISGMTDVTSADADYMLIWDATDSALKKVDMAEVRGAAGGDVTKVGTPVDDQIGVWTGDGTLEGDANLTYDGTTVVLGTGQINFPDSQNASADANTLDDYEEGTWTAVIRGSGTAGTYEIDSQKSNYTKIGRIVHLESSIDMAAALTGGGTGTLQITGCPFTKMANSFPVGSITVAGINFTGTYLNICFFASAATDILYIRETVDDGANVSLPISAILANDTMRFSITFFE